MYICVCTYTQICVCTHIYVYNMYIYIHTHINTMDMYLFIYIYIYIHTHTCIFSRHSCGCDFLDGIMYERSNQAIIIHQPCYKVRHKHVESPIKPGICEGKFETMSRATSLQTPTKVDQEHLCNMMCDMTRLHVWHDSSICDSTHSSRFIKVTCARWCRTWLFQMCDMIHPDVTWRMHHPRNESPDSSKGRSKSPADLQLFSYECRDLFMRVAWRIHICDMTHSHIEHDPSTCVTWPMLLPHNVSLYPSKARSSSLADSWCSHISTMTVSHGIHVNES